MQGSGQVLATAGGCIATAPASKAQLIDHPNTPRPLQRSHIGTHQPQKVYLHWRLGALQQSVHGRRDVAVHPPPVQGDDLHHHIKHRRQGPLRPPLSTGFLAVPAATHSRCHLKHNAHDEQFTVPTSADGQTVYDPSGREHEVFEHGSAKEPRASAVPHQPQAACRPAASSAPGSPAAAAGPGPGRTQRPRLRAGPPP